MPYFVFPHTKVTITTDLAVDTSLTTCLARANRYSSKSALQRNPIGPSKEKMLTAQPVGNLVERVRKEIKSFPSQIPHECTYDKCPKFHRPELCWTLSELKFSQFNDLCFHQNNKLLLSVFPY